MKKTFFTILTLVVVAWIIHFSSASYGWLSGVISRGQARIVENIVETTRDPGHCSLIRGYWARSLRAKLRDRCVTQYVKNSVQNASDCRKEHLVTDMSQLSALFLADEYRYKCLIQHYQSMLGNTLTQNWLPDECLTLRDNLVIMEHYMADLKTSRRMDYSLDHTTSPLSTRDLSVLNQCMWFIDTPEIYSFLRNEKSTDEKTTYVQEQKKKLFEVK